MASNINTNTIDENYPVAGIDNDSQGFRDNFSSIKTNLTTAGAEITTMQANRARIDSDNDFSGNEIQNAELVQVTKKIITTGTTLTANTEIDYRDGHVFKLNFTGAGPYDITFVGWPANRYAELRLLLSASGNFPQLTIDPGNGTRLCANWPSDFTKGQVNFSAVNPSIDYENSTIILDISTNDIGTNLYVNYVGTFNV